MHARLALVDGDARPNILDLAPERPISIGRSRDNSVVLPSDEQASRLHARVYYEGGRWLLRDFGLNGTRVGETRVNQVAELEHGNEICIGAVRFLFSMAGDGSPALPRPNQVVDRPTVEVAAVSAAGQRLTTEDLTALNQFMSGAVEFRDPNDLARSTLQMLYYHTGAALAAWFGLDPTDPIPKLVWPESAPYDEQLTRQLARRVHRDQRLVWMAEDTAATLPTAGPLQVKFVDALALPMKAQGRVHGAMHLYKSSGSFSDKDRKFIETVAGFVGQVLAGLRKRRILEAEVQRIKAHRADGGELLGDSAVMIALRDDLGKAGAGRRPTLIQAEPGLGSETAAVEAHRRGPRAGGPFVAVRCGHHLTALMEAELFGYRRGAFSGADKDHAGYVSQADDGTLFLDEVADLTPDCQAKLLRVLETRTYRPLGVMADVRTDFKLIAATSKDLTAEAAAGRFRNDLLQALKGFELRIPTLRERAEDVPYVAQFYLDRIGADGRRALALTAEAVRALKQQPWLGNVAELRAAVEAAAVAAESDTIDAADFGFGPKT